MVSAVGFASRSQSSRRTYGCPPGSPGIPAPGAICPSGRAGRTV